MGGHIGLFLWAGGGLGDMGGDMGTGEQGGGTWGAHGRPYTSVPVGWGALGDRGGDMGTEGHGGYMGGHVGLFLLAGGDVGVDMGGWGGTHGAFGGGHT